MRMIEHLCSRCGGITRRLMHKDAYGCDQGHEISGISLHTQRPDDVPGRWSE